MRVLAPFALAYAVLWLGGAAEILTFTDELPGDACPIMSDSGRREGREVDLWVGGGLLGRPGVVCEADALLHRGAVIEGGQERRLTQADFLSLVLAGLVFVVAGIVASESRNQERRGPW